MGCGAFTSVAPGDGDAACISTSTSSAAGAQATLALFAACCSAEYCSGVSWGFLKQQHLPYRAHVVIAKAKKVTRAITRPAREPPSALQHSFSDTAQQVSFPETHLSVFLRKGPQLPS